VTVRDPQGRPVDLVGTPFHIAGTTLPHAAIPPRLGQHTDAVLTEVLGVDAARLAELRRQGVIE
jgi:formyl-CoA transferase